MATKRPEKSKTDRRIPWAWPALSSNGGAFLAIGLAFLVIGLSNEKTFIFVGLTFIILAFAMGNEDSAEGNTKAGSAEQDPEKAETEDEPNGR